MKNNPHIVHVPLGERAYDIEIGQGTLSRVGEFLAARRQADHAIVITDERVERPHAQIVAESLGESVEDVDIVVVPAGEASKSVGVVQELWDKLLELKAARSSVVVAVGGGVVGDLAGFVAATFARGIAFLQIPTTLLADVDSAVGGKVGINLPGAKNIVGAFWQPLGVLIDTDVLKTLPDREYRAGLAEVVKYGVILDPDFFSYLEQHVEGLLGRRHDVLQHVIARCCQLKADIVAADERELTGQRVVLNYGHTFCHALETVTGYDTYLHGEAVSIGMMCASRLAERMRRVDAAFTRRQYNLLVALGLPVALLDVDHDALLAAMTRDKKVEHGRLRFVLPTRMGHVELVGDVDPRDVRAALSLG